MNQLSLFDNENKCMNCVFYDGECKHISETGEYTFGCEDGSFKLTHNQTQCSCGAKLEVRQEPFGGDWAVCRCGAHISFQNNGNRIGYLEAYKRGWMK